MSIIEEHSQESSSDMIVDLNFNPDQQDPLIN